MAEAPTYSLAQVIALAKGTTNWFEYAKSGAQHGKNNQDDISTLQSAAFSGATPGWQAAIDLRWYVADTSSSTTTYTGVTKPSATGSDSLFAGYFIIFKPANNNTGASTLNVASSDGAVDIKKISSGAKAALAAGDLDSDTYAELIFDGTDWIMLNAPVTADLVADTSPQLGGDLDCNGAQIQWSQGADVASATALAVLTDGNYFDVTGTTTITSINTTGGVGTLIKLHFDGALTLTHDATDLILPGGANITTAAGDEAEFIEYATGDYRCTNYSKASGEGVIAGGIDCDADSWQRTSATTDQDSNAVVDFATSVHLGSNVTESGGVITVGTAGWYLVHFKFANMSASTQNFNMYLRKNSSRVLGTVYWQTNSEIPYLGSEATVIIECSANDTLDIYGDGYFYGEANNESHTWFTGVRLGA